jgi:hypothetical protein
VSGSSDQAGCSCVAQAAASPHACDRNRSSTRCNWCSHWSECHAGAELARIASLEIALTSLISRIRKVGGYSTPEEQDALRTAEWVLAGGVL